MKSLDNDRLYFAWKTDNRGNPIEGIEKTYRGVSKRAVLKHIAFEEGVEFKPTDLFVICKDGTRWHVTV